MKKILSFVALIGILSLTGAQAANAFSWSRLNPWSKCHKCEKKVKDCTCPTGYASPCETENVTPDCPCDKKITKPVPCDACDRLQQEMKNK